MVALVTGASRGIGRAVAVRLAEEHADVVLVARDADRLAGTGEAVAHAGGTPHVVQLDLTASEAPRELALAVSQTTGRLDVLVNNAGLAPGGPVESYSVADWDRAMAVNARAPFFVTQALLPLLRQARPGYVINMASVVAKKGYAHQAVYTASKHALLGWTKALAREVASDELRVHAILPGGVDTEMIRGVRPDIDPAELIDPREIADVVAQLVAMRGNAVIDEVVVRRRGKVAWD